MHICTITIPFDPQPLAQNKRGHWSNHHKLQQHSKWLAQRAWEESGCPVVYEPVRVRVTVCRGRTIDPDNCLSGLKHVFDGLFKDAITPDDSDAWVSYEPIKQQSGKQWKFEPQVIVEVETQ